MLESTSYWFERKGQKVGAVCEETFPAETLRKTFTEHSASPSGAVGPAKEIRFRCGSDLYKVLGRMKQPDCRTPIVLRRGPYQEKKKQVCWEIVRGNNP